jgi:hypothetical protein
MNEVAHLAQIIIGKQRHGPIGNVTLEFEERFTKFKDTQTKLNSNIKSLNVCSFISKFYT